MRNEPPTQPVRSLEEPHLPGVRSDSDLIDEVSMHAHEQALLQALQQALTNEQRFAELLRSLSGGIQFQNGVALREDLPTIGYLRDQLDRLSAYLVETDRHLATAARRREALQTLATAAAQRLDSIRSEILTKGRSNTRMPLQPVVAPIPTATPTQAPHETATAPAAPADVSVPLDPVQDAQDTVQPLQEAPATDPPVAEDPQAPAASPVPQPMPETSADLLAAAAALTARAAELAGRGL